MKNNEMRSPLGTIEDNNTKYMFTDWTSASKIRNHLNPLLRIDVAVLRNLTEVTDEIMGYQITVYNVNTQVIVYKFYVNYIKDNVWSLNTDEAIYMLNYIGFDCAYDEKVILTDNARAILEACQTMGYTHIKRIVGTADYLLTAGESTERAEFVTGMPLSELLAKTGKYINLYDFRAIGRVPVSIEELLR